MMRLPAFALLATAFTLTVAMPTMDLNVASRQVRGDDAPAADKKAATAGDTPYSYGDDDTWWAEHAGYNTALEASKGTDADAASATAGAGDTAEEAWQKGCDEDMHGTTGALYRGCQSKTRSGKTCQNWKVQDPHKHDRFSDQFPGTGLKNHNYCRNPDKEETIWCYTTDPDTRWEYCDASAKQKAGDPYDYGSDDLWGKSHTGYADLKADNVQSDTGTIKAENCDEAMGEDNGALYRGCQTKTTSGATCQNWKKQKPHKHDRFSNNFPGTGIKNHNYCRNPDNEKTIWCYTTNPDLRWEYCEAAADTGNNGKNAGKDLTATSSSVPPEVAPYSYGDDDTWWAEHVGGYDAAKAGADTAEQAWQKGCDEDLHGDTGALYRGCLSKTKSGKTCQNWKVQDPHKHDRFDDKFPGTGLKDHNYCRNPDKEKTIWCYTTDPDTRWEYCELNATQASDPYDYGTDDNWLSDHKGYDDLKADAVVSDTGTKKADECDESLNGSDGALYRGCQTKTKSGATCQNWKVQSPHTHDRFSNNFPGTGIKNHNYCRNPDHETAIWCYTTDPDLRWEYCEPMAATAAAIAAAAKAAAGGVAVTTKNPASTSSSAPPANAKKFGVYDYGDDDLWANRGSYDTQKDYFGYDSGMRTADKCDETLPYNTQFYRGCQMKTRSGKTCQKWDVQDPHQHDQFSKNFAESALLGHNYCRNPDGEATIWCYTTDPDTRWEFCDPMLDADGKPITTKSPEGAAEKTKGYAYQSYEIVPYSYGDDDTWWSEHAGDDVYGNSAMTDFEDMQEGKCDETYNKNGFTYRGCQTKTKTGKTCQKWDIQTPHAHDRFSSNFPGAGLKRHNYCRNPDNETAIWCYTTDPDTRWEFCSPLPKHSGGGAIHLTASDKKKAEKKHKGDIRSSANDGHDDKKGGGKAAVIVLTIIAICGALFSYRAEIKDKLGLGEAPVGGGIAKLKGKAPKYERVAVN